MRNLRVSICDGYISGIRSVNNTEKLSHEIEIACERIYFETGHWSGILNYAKDQWSQHCQGKSGRVQVH
jgi:hypothetical protein